MFCASSTIGLFRCHLDLWYVVWRPTLKVDVTSSNPFWLKGPLIYLKYPTHETLPHNTGNIKQVEEELLPLVAQSDPLDLCQVDDRGNTHFTFFFTYLDNWGFKWHQTFWEIFLGVHSWLISSLGYHYYRVPHLELCKPSGWLGFFQVPQEQGSLENRVCLHCKVKAWFNRVLEVLEIHCWMSFSCLFLTDSQPCRRTHRNKQSTGSGLKSFINSDLFTAENWGMINYTPWNITYVDKQL